MMEFFKIDNFLRFFIGSSVFFVTVLSESVSGIQIISDGNGTRPSQGIQEELKMLQLTVGTLANLVKTMSQSIEALSRKEDITSRKIDVLTNKVENNSRKLESYAKLINSLPTKVESVSKKTDLNSKKVDSNSKKVDSTSKKVDSNSKKVDSNSKKVDSISKKVASNSLIITSTAKNVSQLQDETASATEYCRLLPSTTCGECTCKDDSRLAAKYFCDCRNLPVKRDCKQYHKEGARIDGIYKVHQNKMRIIQVFCDQSSDGGGWTLIQRRVDGSEKFNRDWATYKKGFGDLQHEHWLGNTNIFTMSLQGLFPLGNELRVELIDWNNVMKFAKYSTFEVGSESAKFQLNIGGYSGTAGDSFTYHQGMKFSTLDRDNDEYPAGNCAIDFFSGFWFRYCHGANVNGRYEDYGHFSGNWQGVYWDLIHGKDYSLKHAQMKMRRRD